MSGQTHEFAGRCHCGSLSMALAFTRPADEMQVRSCQCEFCRRQGSLTVSDPAGRAVIEISAGALATYRFGTGSVNTLICARCGCYAGLCMSEGAKVWSVANARGLDIPDCPASAC